MRGRSMSDRMYSGEDTLRTMVSTQPMKAARVPTKSRNVLVRRAEQEHIHGYLGSGTLNGKCFVERGCRLE